MATNKCHNDSIRSLRKNNSIKTIDKVSNIKSDAVLIEIILWISCFIVFLFGLKVIFLSFFSGLMIIISSLMICPPIWRKYLSKVRLRYICIISFVIFIIGLCIFESSVSTVKTNSSNFQDTSVLSEQDERKDVSVLLNEIETIINEFNENLIIASNYNIDTQKYKDVSKHSLSMTSSYEEVKDKYNQLNEYNTELKELIDKVKSSLYTVIKVVDGDTIKILYEGVEETVRLIGIDTPETVHPNKPVECFGQEASERMKELVEGKSVNIMFDETQGMRDKYGRLLLYVWVEDIFVNKQMVVDGYAYEYTYSTSYIYQKEFKEAQSEAQSSRAGLWGDVCSCENKKIGSTCTSCNIRTVTYQNWDCSTYTDTVRDTSCTVGCAAPIPTPAPAPTAQYICDCSKTCSQISSCEEAYYQLNVCGCTRRDGDGDGVPCENLCK